MSTKANALTSIPSSLERVVKDIVQNAAPSCTVGDYHAEFAHRMEYTLRMFWLGRRDKLNADDLVMCEWMTVNARPASAGEFSGFGNNVVHFQGQNHLQLAHEVCAKTFGLMVEAGVLGTPA